MPEGEEEPDAERASALGGELAGGVVDGRDVVRVEGVAQPERVRGDPEPQPEHTPSREREVMRHDEHEQQEEPDHMQRQHDRPEARQTTPLHAAQMRHRTHPLILADHSRPYPPGGSTKRLVVTLDARSRLLRAGCKASGDPLGSLPLGTTSERIVR